MNQTATMKDDNLLGLALLDDPALNKGTAFTSPPRSA